MKLTFLQKFNAIMLSLFIVGALAASYFSSKAGHTNAAAFVNPIGTPDSTFAVITPEP